MVANCTLFGKRKNWSITFAVELNGKYLYGNRYTAFIMNKQMTFALTAAILLVATVSVGICTSAVNGQSNSTGGTASNMTKSNMTNATSGAAKNLTAAGGIKAQHHIGGGKPAG